jgi:hypothetical protein
MKTYGGVEVENHAFLISTTKEADGQLHASIPIGYKVGWATVRV